jgi:cytochrome P450
MHSRALLRPAFHQQNQERAFEHIELAVEAMFEGVPEGKEVDFQPLFFRLTLETTMFLLFGRRGDVATAAMDRFAAAFDDAQDWLARRGRLGGLYWLIDGPGFRRSCRVVHEFIDAAIESAISKKGERGGGDEKRYSVLGALLLETQDRKVLREQCLNILLAGRDTTACLLSWTW